MEYVLNKEHRSLSPDQLIQWFSLVIDAEITRGIDNEAQRMIKVSIINGLPKVMAMINEIN